MNSTPPPETNKPRLNKEWLDNNTALVSQIDDLLEEVQLFNSRTYWPHEPVEELLSHPYQTGVSAEPFLDPETNDWRSVELELRFEAVANNYLRATKRQREAEENNLALGRQQCISCERWFPSFSPGLMQMCNPCWHYGEETLEDVQESIEVTNHAAAATAGDTCRALVVDGIYYEPTAYHLGIASLK